MFRIDFKGVKSYNAWKNKEFAAKNRMKLNEVL